VYTRPVIPRSRERKLTRCKTRHPALLEDKSSDVDVKLAWANKRKEVKLVRSRPKAARVIHD
jgi:hypothetical protein